MKKGKKNIKDIQSALLSKTGFLNQHDDNESIEHASQQPSLIDENLLEKLEALAEFENVSVKEIVNKALGHFLRLKSMQVEQALKAKQK